MNQQMIARVWRNPLLRLDLPPSMLADLPLHPAGEWSGDETDWGLCMGADTDDQSCEITGTAGCGSAGCSQIVCTDPCGSHGPSCPGRTQLDGCTLASGC